MSTASATVPQDAFERWVALQAWSTDSTNRLDESVDLAFWERVAEDYDSAALAKRVPEVLQRVLQLIPAGASVLDVGAGTGAFSLPIAERASRVTALDYSPAMLRVLQSKLRPMPNVEPVLARWEDADVQPHDVVLAANALYRAADLRLALQKIVDAAQTRGIIVWSVGRRDAQERVRSESYRPGPDYIHVLDGLFALDVFAHVDFIKTGRVAVIWWDSSRP